MNARNSGRYWVLGAEDAWIESFDTNPMQVLDCEPDYLTRSYGCLWIK